MLFLWERSPAPTQRGGGEGGGGGGAHAGPELEDEEEPGGSNPAGQHPRRQDPSRAPVGGGGGGGGCYCWGSFCSGGRSFRITSVANGRPVAGRHPERAPERAREHRLGHEHRTEADGQGRGQHVGLAVAQAERQKGHGLSHSGYLLRSERGCQQGRRGKYAHFTCAYARVLGEREWGLLDGQRRPPAHPFDASRPILASETPFAPSPPPKA